MRGTSPVLAGMLLLAGAAGLLGLAGVTTPEQAAEDAYAWIMEQQGTQVSETRLPETSPGPASMPPPLPTPSPTPRPVPVETVEEAWDEERRMTEPESEPVELPVDDSVSLELRNDTDFAISFPELPDLPAGLDFQCGEPVILIVHTHTTERYTDPEEPGVYRSTDPEDGVMAVGDALAAALEERGYGVIHDKTFCDYPEYDGAYDRSREVIRSDLEAYPSICLVLDVHRDAVEDMDGQQMRMTAEVDGQTMAQLMLVVGTDGGGLEHPDWRQNLSLAAVLQTRMNGKFPNLMRPINLRNQRFNQDLGPMALLVEVGASGNDLEEALRGAVCLGEGLADVLDQYSGKYS